MKTKKFLRSLFGSFLMATMIFGFTGLGTLQAAGSGGDPECGYQQCNGQYYVYNGNDCCVLLHRDRTCLQFFCW